MDTDNKGRTGFRISDGLLEPQLGAAREHPATERAQLPQAFGGPLLFAIPRDPRTLFVYWNVDWQREFGSEEPKGRQVFLRVVDASGVEESESLVEPLLGSFYAPVNKAGADYRAELGYYPPSGSWRTVATSELVNMPPGQASENTVVDVATVPFHLSFQKMIDLFCESNGDPLAMVLARLQDRALAQETAEHLELHPQEGEILRAMNLTIKELRVSRRPFVKKGGEDQALRKRAEAILGFGSSSPAHGFGESSWGSSPG